MSRTALIMASAALLAGCAATAATEEAASMTPKAYIIAEIDVTNPEGYRGYQQAVPPVIAAFGGSYLVRGGQIAPFESDPPTGRIAVLEFPSLEAAQAFAASPEYLAIAPLRQNNSTSRLFIVEGVAPPTE